MKRLTRLLLVLAIATLAIGQEGPSEITGTIRLNGCTAKPADLHLRASTASLYTPADASRAAAPQVAALATIRPSGDNGQEFTFRLSVGEQPGAYRLGVRLTSPDCPQVAWTGPTDGIVFTGGPPVTLEAFAIRTQIEILGEGMGRPGPKWVGADNLDFSDPTVATRRLRIRSTVPNLTSVIFQLSTRPFPTTGRTACEADPPEVIRSVPFSVGGTEIGMTGPRPGEWFELPPINFNDLLIGSREAAAEIAPLDSNVLNQLELGAPLYLRALPVGTDPQRPSDGAVRLCDPSRFGRAGWARVAKLAKILQSLMPIEDPKGAIKLYSAVYKGPEIDPAVPGKGHVCYLVTQPHQLDLPMDGSVTYDRLLVGLYNQTYHNGDWVWPGDGPFCTACCASNDSWFETFTGAVSDLVTGAIDWVGGLVNWAAKIYDSVKKAVGEVIIDAINTVPPGGICTSDFCHGLVQTGIEIGLSSMGMPPSLPNWDALQQEGLDYVAGQIASQTGVPPEVAAKALDYAAATVQKVTEKRGGDQSGAGTLPNWLMEDFGIQPAVLTLTLQKMKEGLLTPPYILHTGYNVAFFPSKLALPQEFPQKFVDGETLRLLKVPIVLNPNLSGLPPCPICSMSDPGWNAEQTTLWYKMQWANTVLKGDPCVKFSQTYNQEFLSWPGIEYGPPYYLSPILEANVYTLTPFDAPLPKFGIYSRCFE